MLNQSARFVSDIPQCVQQISINDKQISINTWNTSQSDTITWNTSHSINLHL